MSFFSKEFGLGNGKNPNPTPKFDVLLVFLETGRQLGTIAGWKLYENLLGGRLSFLLAGIIEFIEPI